MGEQPGSSSIQNDAKSADKDVWSREDKVERTFLNDSPGGQKQLDMTKSVWVPLKQKSVAPTFFVFLSQSVISSSVVPFRTSLEHSKSIVLSFLTCPPQ